MRVAAAGRGGGAGPGGGVVAAGEGGDAGPTREPLQGGVAVGEGLSLR